MRASPRELEDLLAHGPWLRALARSLVRDPSRADDLVQQAWLKALERPPAPCSSARGWFATVLRNFARQEHRAESRRATREQLATTGAPEALGVTLELAQQLAQAVGALDEPYRSTIFRRYYESLAPRRIAALDGVPLKTVKSRLARGLEKLRERLDREHDGDRGAWVAACLPLVRIPKTALVLGGILVNIKLACVAAGILLIGAWAVLHGSGAGLPELPGDPGAGGTPLAAALDARGELAGGARSDAREVAPAAGAAAAVCPYPRPRIDLAGRVVDAHGLPLAGVRLFLVTADQALELRQAHSSSAACETVASSGADGRFSIQPRVAQNVLMGERAGLVTLLACETWSTDGSKELLVVMAPPTDVAGFVVDGEERPIAGAEVRVVAGEGVRSALGIPSDTAVEVPWKTRSDAAGRFVLEGVPGVREVELQASHARHAEGSIAMPESVRRDLRIVLAGREVKLLTGEVRELDGQLVPDALVGMGQISTRSDANGRFEIELDPLFPGMKERSHSKILGAVKPGRLPARMSEPEDGWPEFVTLVLGGEPLSIRGLLLDAEAKPAIGIEVRLVNEHLLGMLAASVGQFSYPRTLEGIARGSDEMETPAFSNRTGEFVLRGLLDEDYVLRAFDPRTLRMVESAPVRAGSQGVVLSFPAAAGTSCVAGRVLSLRGDPLAGVMLVPSRPASGPLAPQLSGEMRQSDAEGHFDFGVIATEGLEFQVMGAGLQTLVGWKLPEGKKFAELEVRVPRRCQLQVDLADRVGLADALVVLDEHGQKLELWIEVRNVSSFEFMQPFREGKSDVLLVAEDAAQVVLLKGGEEVQRQPVRLKPEGLEIVRF